MDADADFNDELQSLLRYYSCETINEVKINIICGGRRGMSGFGIVVVAVFVFGVIEFYKVVLGR